MVILRKNLSKRNSSQKNTKGGKKQSRIAKKNNKTINGGQLTSEELQKDDWDLMTLRSNILTLVDNKMEEIIESKIELYKLKDEIAPLANPGLIKKFFNENKIKRLEEEIKRLEALITKLETEHKLLEDTCLSDVGAIQEVLMKRDKKPNEHLEQEMCVKKPLHRTFMRDTHVEHSKLALYNKYNPTKMVNITKNEPVIAKTT